MEWQIPKLSLDTPPPKLRHVVRSLKLRCDQWQLWFVALGLFCFSRSAIRGIIPSSQSVSLSPTCISAYRGPCNSWSTVWECWWYHLTSEPQRTGTCRPYLLFSRLPMKKYKSSQVKDWGSRKRTVRKRKEGLGASAQPGHQSWGLGRVFSAHDSVKDASHTHTKSCRVS